MKRIDIVGKIYGNWQVLELYNNSYVKCICLGCDSKIVKLVGRSNLVGGRSSSCGCREIEKMKKTNLAKYGVEFNTHKAVVVSLEVRTKKVYGKKLGAGLTYGRTKQKRVRIRKYGVKLGVGIPYGKRRAQKKKPYGGILGEKLIYGGVKKKRKNKVRNLFIIKEKTQPDNLHLAELI